MRTHDLAAAPSATRELLDMAGEDSVVIRTPDGRTFCVTELDESHDNTDDFADEVARTRQNKALMDLLAERAKEPGAYTLDEVRERLGLPRS